MMGADHTNAILARALELAAVDIPAFPCKPDKIPYTRRGFKDATTDPEQIRVLWSKWPDAMIGMPTGQVSGFWALDIDAPKAGQPGNGYKSLDKLLTKHGPLPSTWSQKTAGGGLHYFFRYPRDGRHIRNSAGKIDINIDVKGEGGYVILAPSTNKEGRVYETICGCEAADAPAWLLDLVLSPPAREQDKTGQKLRQYHGGPIHPYVQAAIDKELALLALATPGTRNNTLNKTAFALGQWVAGGELPEDEARTMLFQAALACGLEA